MILAGTRCASRKPDAIVWRPLPGTYFVANSQIVCETCRQAVKEQWNRGGAAARLGKAAGLGVLD
jgi:hypothetical protein